MIGWLITGALAIWVTTVIMVLYAGSRPVIREADAILVLGAAQYNGRPSPVLKARLDHAISLFHKGLAKKNDLHRRCRCRRYAKRR